MDPRSWQQARQQVPVATPGAPQRRRPAVSTGVFLDPRRRSELALLRGMGLAFCVLIAAPAIVLALALVTGHASAVHLSGGASTPAALQPLAWARLLAGLAMLAPFARQQAGAVVWGGACLAGAATLVCTFG